MTPIPTGPIMSAINLVLIICDNTVAIVAIESLDTDFIKSLIITSSKILEY